MSCNRPECKNIVGCFYDNKPCEKERPVDRGVNCQHTITRGKEGQKGSWCVGCGEKIYEVESRECKDCKHFFERVNYTGCRKHLMAVIPAMNVTYEIEKGTCWEGG